MNSRQALEQMKLGKTITFAGKTLHASWGCGDVFSRCDFDVCCEMIESEAEWLTSKEDDFEVENNGLDEQKGAKS